ESADFGAPDGHLAGGGEFFLRVDGLTRSLRVVCLRRVAMQNVQVERRRFERVQFFCEVQLTALPEGKVYAARSLDISLGGVGLVVQASFKPGQIVAVSFLLGDKLGAEIGNRVMGRVANLRADADANLIGVEFDEPLNHSANPRLFRKVMDI